MEPIKSDVIKTSENIVEEIIENKSLETISNVSQKESLSELEVKTICEIHKARMIPPVIFKMNHRII